MTNRRSLSQDESALYNEAYIGFLLYSIIREHEESSGKGLSSNLAFLAVPLSANRIFSSRLPNSVTTSIDKWVGQNDGYIALLPELVEGFVPIVIEAIQFLSITGAIKMDNESRLSIAGSSLPKSPTLFDKSTDMKESLRAARLLGRWFCQFDSDATAYAKLGVRP